VSADASQSWRQHFSRPAADILQIAACLAGFDMKDILLRCFKRSRRGQKVNEPTVLAVLQEIADEAEGKAEALARRLAEREKFMAGRKAKAEGNADDSRR
jgi:hypothetical protein